MQAKNEVELISRYREMAMQPEIESAIDDIMNEAIVQDDDGKIIVIMLVMIMRIMIILQLALTSKARDAKIKQ